MNTTKDIDAAILAIAQLLGDPYGFEMDTVDYIASELQISTDEVQEVLNNDSIAAMLEYAERSADLDAEHYAKV